MPPGMISIAVGASPLRQIKQKAHLPPKAVWKVPAMTGTRAAGQTGATIGNAVLHGASIFNARMMETLRKNTAVKRLRNRYRLLVMNDDTFEEVIVFRLTRVSVYVAASTIFVLLVGLTLAVISFTNLRFLIPGYGKQSSLQELRLLKMKTDSLEKSLATQRLYLDDLQKVLKGDTAMLVRDTSSLKLPAATEEITD